MKAKERVRWRERERNHEYSIVALWEKVCAYEYMCVCVVLFSMSNVLKLDQVSIFNPYLTQLR